MNILRTDTAEILSEAQACVGPDAKPSGHLRMLTSPNRGRLQQLWTGCYGTVWLDVPTALVDEIPPRHGDARMKP